MRDGRKIRKMEIKSIIFDWSGVISDDIVQVRNTTNNILRLYGARPISLEEFKKTAQVPSSKQWKLYLPNIPIEVIQKDFNSLFLHEERPKIFPWVRATLDFLVSKSINLYVLSAHPQHFLENEARYNNISKYFSAIYGGKYYKERFLAELINNNGMSKSNTLYVEDMADNIVAGKEAGIKTVAVLSGYHDEAKLRKVGPDHTFKDISGLKTLFQ